MQIISAESVICPLCKANDSEIFSLRGEQRESGFFCCQQMFCNTCGHFWLTDWIEDIEQGEHVADYIDRNFDDEQQTGVCSYCGSQLEVGESPDGLLYFATCKACDAYNDERAAEEWLDEFEDHYPPSDFDQRGMRIGNLGDIPF
jgi:hypothetical protein